MRYGILAVFGAGLLAACSASPGGVSGGSVAAPAAATGGVDPLAQLSAFTLTDLANADKIAVAQGDAIGHACFPALSTFVASIPAPPSLGGVSGGVSAFELARSTRLKVQGTAMAGVPDYLKLACAALVVDEQTFLASLAGIGLGASALAPAAPLLLKAP